MDWRNLETLQASQPCVATIGFFDGVHRGHQFLIHRLVEDAHAAGLQSLVITFDRHPRQVVCPSWQPELLSTLDEKKLLLSKTGVDACCVLPFNKQMAALSAHAFMKQVLREQLNVRKLYVGYDNRFGHDRTESFDDYVRYGLELGMEVVRGDKLEALGTKHTAISSSLIRQYIKAGEVENAEQALGYPYQLTGMVTTGYQEGRKLGFPTANLDLNSIGKLVPAPGVYAVMVRVEGSVGWKRAMMNIGTRPTFDGNSLTIETHIFQFEDDIYHKKLTISVISRIREEHRFDSVEALAAQLRKDKKAVEACFLSRHGE